MRTAAASPKILAETDTNENRSGNKLFAVIEDTCRGKERPPELRGGVA
jgi:hypothetical protein